MLLIPTFLTSSRWFICKPREIPVSYLGIWITYALLRSKWLQNLFGILDLLCYLAMFKHRCSILLSTLEVFRWIICYFYSSSFIVAVNYEIVELSSIHQYHFPLRKFFIMVDSWLTILICFTRSSYSSSFPSSVSKAIGWTFTLKSPLLCEPRGIF